MQPLSLGDLTVTRVVEEEGPTSPRFILPDATDEALAAHREWLAPHFVTPDNKLILSIHSFVVRTRHHTILVDTCLGNDKPRSIPDWSMRQGPYLQDLQRAGVAPEEVDYVLCTHLHVDHVGWNTRLEDGRWVPTFPNATYLFGRAEYEHWRQVTDDDFGAVFADSVAPVMEAGQAELVEHEFVLGDHVRLEPTPGHTPGHCSVHLTAGGREAVITGDMIHHPVQCAETDWVSRFCVDPPTARATRRAFLERYADRDVTILGTHFGAPTAVKVVSHGDTWRVLV